MTIHNCCVSVIVDNAIDNKIHCDYDIYGYSLIHYVSLFKCCECLDKLIDNGVDTQCETRTAEKYSSIIICIFSKSLAPLMIPMFKSSVFTEGFIEDPIHGLVKIV